MKTFIVEMMMFLLADDFSDKNFSTSFEVLVSFDLNIRAVAIFKYTICVYCKDSHLLQGERLIEWSLRIQTG